MKRYEIIDGISSWQSILNSDSDIISFFNNGNSFRYTLPANASSSAYIHVYPVLRDGVPSFFVIPSEFDNAAYDSTIEQYVTDYKISKNAVVEESGVVSTSTANRIPDTEAQDRISAWDNDFATWIPQQVATTDGIFQAFAIPIGSFEVEKSTIHLALQPGKELATAELIVINQNDDREIFYDDFVRPVPPYGAALPQSDFYLFQL